MMASMKPKKFEMRGDLGTSVIQSDCDLIAGDHKFHVHKAIIASRGGRLERLIKRRRTRMRIRKGEEESRDKEEGEGARIYK